MKFARFDPQAPEADNATYTRLIRKVVSTAPRKNLPESQKVIIPGFPDLRTFSRAKEKLLKEECGSATQSYLQRGNWRMIFPFTRRQQAHAAERLLACLNEQPAAIVHLVSFPRLSINHAMVLFDARETGGRIELVAYDPNDPEKPAVLSYDRKDRAFYLPANNYFPGGRVHVYQIYHRWDY